MTCVWNGILAVLDEDDKIALGLKVKIPQTLVDCLKAVNKLVHRVKWNDEDLSKQQHEENKKRIDAISDIRNGYLCSACEPVMFLLADILNVDIYHSFNSVLIKYTVDKPRKTLYFANDRGHFWNTTKEVIERKTLRMRQRPPIISRAVEIDKITPIKVTSAKTAVKSTVPSTSIKVSNPSINKTYRQVNTSDARRYGRIKPRNSILGSKTIYIGQ